MTAPEDFAGRVALVTGAASGIGAAVVTRLAADGAHVAVADNDCLGAERTVRSAAGRWSRPPDRPTRCRQRGR